MRAIVTALLVVAAAILIVQSLLVPDYFAEPFVRPYHGETLQAIQVMIPTTGGYHVLLRVFRDGKEVPTSTPESPINATVMLGSESIASAESGGGWSQDYVDFRYWTFPARAGDRVSHSVSPAGKWRAFPGYRTSIAVQRDFTDYATYFVLVQGRQVLAALCLMVVGPLWAKRLLRQWFSNRTRSDAVLDHEGV